VQAELAQLERACCTLDGDRVRGILRPAPGYSSEARADFYATLSGLAAELAEQGLVVLVPATAHLRKYREEARARAPNFLEVWLDADVAECRRRDAKGLYAAFSAGTVHELPGEDLPFEAPEAPDVRASGGEDSTALREIIRRASAPL